MYTSTIIATLFAAAAIAAPASDNAITARKPAEAQVQAAQASLDVLVANGCNVLGTSVRSDHLHCITLT